MYSRVFESEDEMDDSAESAAGENEGPEYAFEGFEIQFSKKIVLTPVAVVNKVTVPR